MPLICWPSRATLLAGMAIPSAVLLIVCYFRRAVHALNVVYCCYDGFCTYGFIALNHTTDDGGYLGRQMGKNLLFQEAVGRTHGTLVAPNTVFIVSTLVLASTSYI